MNPESGSAERAAAAWLARRDGDGWSPTEQAALDAWLAEDTAHRVAYLRLQAAWREAGRLKALGAGADAGHVPARGAWLRSPYFHSPASLEQRRAHRARRRTRFSPWPAAIAAAMLVVALACGLWWWQGIDQVQRGSWHTALGGALVVHLADGSTATLASDSALRTALTRRERDLDLVRGEAFFEVAKDHSRPFVVHAGPYQVIAVGTRFDVRRDDRGMRVVVTRGVVRLQSTDGPVPATELPAGSIARVTDGRLIVQHLPLEQVVQYLSWRDGYVVFHGTPLADAVREFNRYNARKIVIADPSLDPLKVGGNFRLDNSDAFVRLVQEAFPVRAESRGDLIVLSRRSQPRASD